MLALLWLILKDMNQTQVSECSSRWLTFHVLRRLQEKDRVLIELYKKDHKVFWTLFPNGVIIRNQFQSKTDYTPIDEAIHQLFWKNKFYISWVYPLFRNFIFVSLRKEGF